jgi:geranylgeranylglycerol-phosphate geranylgeranyltransferase
MARIEGLLRLMRPLNCIVMSLAVLVGASLTGLGNLQGVNLLFSAITAFTLTGAAMAVNDYYDFDIDKINEPNRPIPSGQVSLKTALVTTAVLTLIGLSSAFVISLFCLLFATVAWIIMVTYTTIGKRAGFPGNLLVSACVAAPFLFGSIVATNTITINILLFASMAFLSNTGREIAKGIVDIEGDSQHKIKTLAVVFGRKKAALAAAIFFISAVCLSTTPLILNIISIWFIPFVLVTDVGLLWCSVSLLKNPERENSRKIKKTVLFLFIFGLLAFIFGMLG